jgi:hypothetical protein
MHAVVDARRPHTLPMHSAHSLGCAGVGHLQSVHAQLISRSRQTCAFVTFECAAAAAIDHGSALPWWRSDGVYPVRHSNNITVCASESYHLLHLSVSLFVMRAQAQGAGHEQPAGPRTTAHGSRLTGVFSLQGHVQYAVMVELGVPVVPCELLLAHRKAHPLRSFVLGPPGPAGARRISRLGRSDGLLITESKIIVLDDASERVARMPDKEMPEKSYKESLQLRGVTHRSTTNARV